LSVFTKKGNRTIEPPFGQPMRSGALWAAYPTCDGESGSMTTELTTESIAQLDLTVPSTLMSGSPIGEDYIQKCHRVPCIRTSDPKILRFARYRYMIRDILLRAPASRKGCENHGSMSQTTADAGCGCRQSTTLRCCSIHAVQSTGVPSRLEASTAGSRLARLLAMGVAGTAHVQARPEAPFSGPPSAGLHQRASNAHAMRTSK
jgi:hypothetical protein